MRRTGRVIALAIGMAALFEVKLALAQESLDQGKTPAQLFASDCAICHKSPRGLSQGGGMFGLQSFLRAHYTASVQSAAALAAYLQAVDREAPPAGARTTRRPPTQPPAPKARPRPSEEGKGGEQAIKDDIKPDGGKPAAGRPDEPKPADTTPGGSAPSEAQAAPDGASKPEVDPAPASTPEPKPENAGASGPKAGTGDSVPDIIKPEKTN
jgi:hypothetical protein